MDIIKVIYIIVIIIWVIVIWYLGLYKTDIIGWILLLLPILIFGINISELDECTKEVEESMFEGNFLSFGFLIAVILINWNKTEDKTKYFKLLTLGLVLLMLSLVDIWVRKEKLIVFKHIKSIFQTLALFILAYTLYIYYRAQCSCSPDVSSAPLFT